VQRLQQFYWKWIRQNKEKSHKNEQEVGALSVKPTLFSTAHAYPAPHAEHFYVTLIENGEIKK